MRVQEKFSASCAKMTEESVNGGPEVPSGSKRGFGLREVDGTRSPNLTSPEYDRNCSVAGGRLKFFKDGKFILELSHQKDGDRTSWVSVPKKTYWSQPAAGGTPRQESSTSLSVSDDNSSVQSSPWQRDHCWKQSNPRRDISKEMTFFMQPLQHIKEIRNLHFYSHNIRKKRRCPYDPIDESVLSLNSKNNTKLVRVKQIGPTRPNLTVIVQTLIERISGPSSTDSVTCSSSGVSGVLQNQVRTVNVAAGRMDPSIVSPRKRILREMERVSLEDLANSKRQRARTTSALPHNNNNGSSGNCTITCQTLQPSSILPFPSQSSAKANVSNYSITSLLGNNRNLVLNSGTSDSEPSFLRTLLKSPSQQSATSPEPSPRSRTNMKSKSDGNRKSSPTQHQQICSSSPNLSPSPDSRHCGIRAPAIPSMGSSPQQHFPPFIAPPLLYPSPYLSQHPAPALNQHPYYPGLPPVPSSYRGSPSPGWVQYPLSSLPRGTLYPGLVAPPLSPWGPMSHQPLDDGASDVPLNLSKHAG
ncbi:protein hairless [Anabrus simplex]|uniref:protein hairless n=1 Tax=Anabrus simplex TaxID=316456 RepID=UPI0035A305BB